MLFRSDGCTFTASTDRQCDCREGFFGSGTDCVAWRTCGTNAEQSVAGNSTHDRACECSDGSWADDGGADSDCTTWTVCSNDDHKEVLSTGTTSTDVVCQCSDGYFLDAATDTCRAWQVCGEQQWESQAPSEALDRGCSDWTVCDTDTQWIIQEGSSTRDTSCSDLLSCDATTEYQVAAATAFADRTCEPLTVCNYTTQFDVIEAAVDRDRVCQDLTVCSDNGVETNAPTTSSDRTCECAGEYWGDGETCTPWTVCESFELETGQYETAGPNITTDRECANLTVCSANGQQVLNASAISDRTCGCTGEYWGDGETCTPWTVCDTLTEYQAMAPNTTADRDCAMVSSCNWAVEYESVAAEAESDRQCSPLTVCNDTQFELVARTSTSDRVCSDLTVCDYPDTEYESVPPTEVNGVVVGDRECDQLTVCDANATVVVNETENSDRTCQCSVPTLEELQELCQIGRAHV